MESINIRTGFGYFRDSSGRIVSKAKLPAGSHPIKDGFTYGEVASQAELDAVEIYIDPAEIGKAANEKKIIDKIRADAISALVSTGDLPGGYK